MKFIRLLLVSSIVIGLIYGCGGGGGGGGSGGVAPGDEGLTGSVSYPRNSTKPIPSKPTPGAPVQESYKIENSNASLVGISNANVHAFGVNDDGSFTSLGQKQTDSNGNYNFSRDELKKDGVDYGASGNTIIVHVTFNSPVTGQPVACRRFVDSDDANDKTNANCNPIIELILQRFIKSFTDFNITITKSTIRNILAQFKACLQQTDDELAQGIKFIIDEINLIQANVNVNTTGLSIFTGGIADLTSFQTEIHSLFTNAEINLISLTGDEDLKKIKIIEFLCLLGFKVSTASSTKAYMRIPRPFFFTPFGEITINGITRADSTTRPDLLSGYPMNPDIYVVDPSLVFVDADSNGILDELDAFKAGDQSKLIMVFKKCRLLHLLDDMPAVTIQFVCEFAKHIGSTIKVRTVAEAVANNFKWRIENFLEGPDGQVFESDEIDRPLHLGGPDVTPTEILAQLLQPIPATPLAFATKIAKSEGFLFEIADECINDAMKHVFDQGLDPDVVIFKNLTSLDAIKTFCINETLYVSGRRPIWKERVEQIRQLIYCGIDPLFLGTTLKEDTMLDLKTAMLLMAIIFQNNYLINPTAGWVRNIALNIGSITYYAVEPRWDNICFLDVKTADPLKAIMKAMIPTFDDTIPTEDSTFFNLLDTKLQIIICPDWDRGIVQQVNFSSTADARITHIILKSDGTPAQGLNVKFFSIATTGELTLLDTTTTDTNGYFSSITSPGIIPLDTEIEIQITSVDFADPFIFNLRTDRYGGIHTDFDNNGTIDRVIYHLGWFPDDPYFPLTDVTIKRQQPCILPPPVSNVTFPRVTLFDNDRVDFGKIGQPDFINGSTSHIQVEMVSLTLQSVSPITITDIDEAGLGLEGGLQVVLNQGGSGSLTNIAAYRVGGTIGTSVSPFSASTFDDTVYPPKKKSSLYLIERPGETFGCLDIDVNGTLDHIAWIIEVETIDGGEFTSSIPVSTVLAFVMVNDVNGTISVPTQNTGASINTTAYFPLNVNDIREFKSRKFATGTNVNSGTTTTGENNLPPIGSEAFVEKTALLPSSFPDDYAFKALLISNGVAIKEYRSLLDPANFDSEMYWGRDTNGNLLLFGFGDGTTHLTLFEPPIIVACQLVKVGEIISNNINVKTYLSTTTAPAYDAAAPLANTSAEEYSSEMVGFEDVTVPAGTFTNCFHVRFHFGPSFAVTEEHNMWMAQNIGMIKSVSFEQGEREKEDAVLVRYSVNSGTLVGGNPNNMFASNIHLLRQTINPSPGETFNLNFKAQIFASSNITSITVTGPGITSLPLTFDGKGNFNGSAIIPESSLTPSTDQYTFTSNIGTTTSEMYYSKPGATINNSPFIQVDTTTIPSAFIVTWPDISSFINEVSQLHVEIQDSTPFPPIIVRQRLHLPTSTTSVTFLKGSLTGTSFNAIVIYQDAFGNLSITLGQGFVLP